MKPNSLEYLTYYTESDGFRFHLSPDCPHAMDGKIVQLVMGKLQPEQWFKDTRRRRIMSYDGLLIKLYTFHGFSDVRHSRRYASREVECYHDYLEAFGTMEGIRLPRLYGYFEKPFLKILFRANGIIEEYIPGTRIMGMEELDLAAPLFAHLYRKGIYHPDMQFQNVLWQEDTHTLVPIDYMNCNILAKANWEALLKQLAWFLQAANIDDTRARLFMESVLELLPELRLDKEKAWRCIQALYKIPVETHQYRHPIFLPEELRKQTQPET
ncbi:MAG: hypothetical protein IKP58_11165 [Victivallales bacterium]|nr:hypothetical protein [Victivallales bacterium]